MEELVALQWWQLLFESFIRSTVLHERRRHACTGRGKRLVRYLLYPMASLDDIFHHRHRHHHHHHHRLMLYIPLNIELPLDTEPPLGV